MRSPASPATACASGWVLARRPQAAHPRSESAWASASPRPRDAPVTIPRIRVRVQVQVSFKSSGRCASSFRTVPRPRGEVARRSGGRPRRFASTRNESDHLRAGGSGHRRYRGRCCAVSRSSSSPPASGLTLEEDRRRTRQAALTTRRPYRRDWSMLSSRWTARIDERIAELERLRLGLTECIGCGCLSLDRCKLSSPERPCRRLGPGPRYWIGDRLPA